MDRDKLFSAVTYTHVACLEQRGVTMDCLYLEVEGQSCLVGSVDQGLMKNRHVDLLDLMTPKRVRKKQFSHIFPIIATLPGIFSFFFSHPPADGEK